jgi:hypothetical protein
MLLVVEEAVVLVDDLPESLKVPLCGIGKFLLVDAGRQDEKRHEAADGDDSLR